MGKVTLEMWHHTNDLLIDTETFTIIDGLNTIHPHQSFSPMEFSHINKTDLADPAFNVSGPIDGIIGVNVLSRHFGSRMKLAPFDLITQETSFGWIVFGGRTPDESVDNGGRDYSQ